MSKEAFIFLLFRIFTKNHLLLRCHISYPHNVDKTKQVGPRLGLCADFLLLQQRSFLTNVNQRQVGGKKGQKHVNVVCEHLLQIHILLGACKQKCFIKKYFNPLRCLSSLQFLTFCMSLTKRQLKNLQTFLSVDLIVL